MCAGRNMEPPKILGRFRAVSRPAHGKAFGEYISLCASIDKGFRVFLIVESSKLDYSFA